LNTDVGPMRGPRAAKVIAEVLILHANIAPELAGSLADAILIALRQTGHVLLPRQE
jgi:hypothetical protein